MKKEVLLGLVMLQLAACGGGGGGSGGNNNNGSDTPPVVVPPVEEPETPEEPTPEEPVPEEPVVQPRTLAIQQMAWLQVVQQDMDDEEAVLASNKETRVRVDVTSERDDEVLPTNSALHLCSAPTTCESFALVPNSINAPKTINDAVLSHSYVAVIPANKLTSSLTTYAVHVDTDSEAETTNPLYKTGTVLIKDIQSESLVIRQVTFEGQTGQLPSVDNLKLLLERTYPHSNLTVANATVAATVLPTSLTVGKATSVENGIYTFPLDVLNEFMNEMDVDYCREQPQCHSAKDAFVSSEQPFLMPHAALASLLLAWR